MLNHAPPIRIVLLNSAVLTSNGVFRMSAITLESARILVQARGFLSAIGHADTARVISELLGIDCPANRIRFAQQVGEVALVFRLHQRPPEGKILTCAELEATGFSWARLERLA